MDKKTFLCLIVFTLICTLTILFIHHFTTFSPISIAYDINPTNYMDKAITIDNIRNITAYANHYAVPASLFAFIFVMLCSQQHFLSSGVYVYAPFAEGFFIK